jgi:hypothetical protein
MTEHFSLMEFCRDLYNVSKKSGTPMQVGVPFFLHFTARCAKNDTKRNVMPSGSGGAHVVAIFSTRARAFLL